jgi:alkylhydroperoxidase family enzyme
MLDFAVKLTEQPDKIEEADRQACARPDFTDRDIWDIAAVAAFYNMTNRMAAAPTCVPIRSTTTWSGNVWTS